MYLLKSLVSKDIERWDYKRYVLFVGGYSENDIYKISAFFSLNNVDNEGPFWAGFHKVIYKQQKIILRLIKSFSNLSWFVFRKYVVNGIINLKYKIKLYLLWDKVSSYINLSSVGVVVEKVPNLKTSYFVVHIPVELIFLHVSILAILLKSRWMSETPWYQNTKVVRQHEWF